ncbi:MAG: TetR/AcrR family transcriptional regulator [Oscillospiraceae bacterium]|nr:TetR/AcrR family transcriptional regulator [Oscillospiraceae bacterium]
MEEQEKKAAGGKGLRSQLIQAGTEELNAHGLEGFSVRRVAASCGVSCAAPYKYFKDKQAFICAIISNINQQWSKYQHAATQGLSGTRDKLLAVCMAYVRFLSEFPQFRAIIMMEYSGQDEQFNLLRGQLNAQTYALVSRLCKEQSIGEEARRRKLYVFRSLIYGAALMFDKGEMEYNEESLALVRQTLERELDLP